MTLNENAVANRIKGTLRDEPRGVCAICQVSCATYYRLQQSVPTPFMCITHSRAKCTVSVREKSKDMAKKYSREYSRLQGKLFIQNLTNTFQDGKILIGPVDYNGGGCVTVMVVGYGYGAENGTSCLLRRRLDTDCSCRHIDI